MIVDCSLISQIYPNPRNLLELFPRKGSIQLLPNKKNGIIFTSHVRK